MPKCTPEHARRLREAAARRIGLEGYVRLYASLRDEPMTADEIAAKNDVGQLAVLLIMRHLLDRGLVHRCRWVRPKPHSRMIPVWAFGPGCDVSMPQYEERYRFKRRRERRAPSTLMTMTTVLEMLTEMPMSHQEIADELCMSKDSAYRIIGILRAHKLVHIASWNKPALGTTTPEFKAGNRPNARRPPRARNAEYFADRRRRAADIRTLRAIAGCTEPERQAA